MSDNAYHVFDTPHPIELKVELMTGEIDIDADGSGQTTVKLEPIHGDSVAKDLIADARVEQSGNKVSVIMPKNRGGGFFGRKGQVHATIRVPHESSLRIDTASADIEARGRFGHTQINSGSGDIEMGEIASGDLKCGSGDVDVEAVDGGIKVKMGSGDITLGPVGGDADLLAGSGDVSLEGVEGTLKVKTGSGDVRLDSAGDRVDAMAGSGDVVIVQAKRGEVYAKTGSGDVTIGVAHGTAAYLDIQTVTGDVRSSLDATDMPHDGESTVSINVISGTGDVVLQRA